LAAQKAAIEVYATKMGYEIVQTFEEIASAMGKDSIKKRGVLREAVQLALQNGATILVHDITRVSRHAASVTALVRDTRVRILEVATGDKMEGVLLQVAAARAESHGRAISTTTKKALSDLQKQGVKLGNTRNLPEAQALGAKSVRQKADRIVSDIADFLGAVPEYVDFSAAKVVELLNASGLRSGQAKLWTVSGVRRPLAKAKALLEERDFQKMKDENPMFGMF
jgi:DNA invertase Pin-like site-specific DNA recombinase